MDTVFMFGKHSKIAVIGCGAIGGITAGLIKQQGYDVEVVCKHRDLSNQIRSFGLHIFGIKGDHTIKMPAVAEISELSGTKDIVLLATKAYDAMDAAKKVIPFLTDQSMIVSMQNGICEDDLGNIFGRDRTIGCVVGWGATMHKPGELEMTSTGEFIIGNIDHQADQRLIPLKKMLDAVVPVVISENIMGNLYAKLIVNSCITSLGAVCGLYLGDMLRIKKNRNIFIEIIREAIAIADAMDLHVEPMAGKIDCYQFLNGTGRLSEFKRHLLIRIIGFKYRRLKSSSLQSLERGNPTEIDYFNGYISKKGKTYDIPTPVNDKLIETIKEIEAGKRKIALNNLDEI